ncbi:LysR family transcriptional regulator [Rhizorhabdus dicambivorans]|uniref:LysR family transcriptional regulator n=1 Tax=Rhizorhabdus dicambivorans TaxID=1850238 RepID=A0A2A4FYE4_9SPHN|nr:LysR family transcriptional regulator [Rhizorhabdus dicambivorans]ATE64203.1 LysR family transcriptional regulator [Rhizorhabdus dicambivorans]PCE42524.1 LysR family transcriptional regulator [Rhizorhabdus dicambivorans]
MDVDLARAVRFFYVAEGTSFIRAAQKLHVDPTWLSRQIQQLETQLGCRLLKRTTRNVTLTPEGQQLFSAVKQLANAANQAQAVAYALEQKKSLQLTVGISSSTFWIPVRQALLTSFRSRHPNMVISTTAKTSTELFDDLMQGAVDIAIIGAVKPMDEFDRTVIYRNSPFLLIPRESPLADKPTITMSDFRDLDVVFPVIDNNFSFELIYQPFLNAGARPHWSPEGVYAAMYFAASRRMGMIAWGFEHVISDSLVLREISDCTAMMEVVALKNKDDERRAVRTFWSTAQNVENIRKG